MGGTEGRRQKKLVFDFSKAREGIPGEDLDSFYKSDQGGVLWVGNVKVAKSLKKLKSYNITGVINTTKKQFDNFHNDTLDYMEFDIADYQITKVDDEQTVPTILEFVKTLGPFFEFIDGKLEKGESVLLHCRSGRHRSPVAGMIILMNYLGFNSTTAHAEALKRRPVIDFRKYYLPLLTICDHIPRQDGSNQFALCPDNSNINMEEIYKIFESKRQKRRWRKIEKKNNNDKNIRDKKKIRKDRMRKN